MNAGKPWRGNYKEWQQGATTVTTLDAELSEPLGKISTVSWTMHIDGTIGRLAEDVLQIELLSTAMAPHPKA